MRAPRLAALTVLLAGAACTPVLSPDRPDRQGVAPAVRSDVALVAMRQGPEALARFEPRVAPRYDGGECRPEPALAPGARALTAHYPAIEGAHTTVRIEVGDDGRTLRYMENRGLPEPLPDPEAMRKAFMELPRTTVHLDYDTGEASVMNWGEPAMEGVRGKVTDFERTEVLGDLAARAQAVLRLCSEQAA
jgi:hypothetical protein